MHRSFASGSGESPRKGRSQPRTAFVTGATGFVGSFLVDRLLQDGWHVVALARGAEAAARVGAALRNVRDAADPAVPLGDRLRVIAGDVQHPLLGLDESQAARLSREVDAVWHCAAKFGPGNSAETPFSVNVTGTRNLLAFTSRCNRHRPVPFYHVSTAFAADSRRGLARETATRPGGAGRNEYERSKREAERVILHWRKSTGCPAAIFRPSIILGHARTGRASGFAAYYDFLRSLCVFARIQQAEARTGGRAVAGLRVRTRSDLRMNLVTIDFVIDAMCALARAPRGAGAIFHLVNEEPVTVGSVVKVMCRSIGLKGVEFAGAGAFAKVPMTRSERLFHTMIGFERPYLEEEIIFDNRRFRRLVPAGVLPAPRITEPLLRRINRGYLEYCERQAAESRAGRPPPPDKPDVPRAAAR